VEKRTAENGKRDISWNCLPYVRAIRRWYAIDDDFRQIRRQSRKRRRTESSILCNLDYVSWNWAQLSSIHLLSIETRIWWFFECSKCPPLRRILRCKTPKPTDRLILKSRSFNQSSRNSNHYHETIEKNKLIHVYAINNFNNKKFLILYTQKERFVKTTKNFTDLNFNKSIAITQPFFYFYFYFFIKLAKLYSWIKLAIIENQSNI